MNKGIQPIEDMIAEEINERIDTISSAPTVLMGFNETEDRLLDVRPPSHIPGKGRAPKPPTPAPKNPPPPAAPFESPYERLHGKAVKVNKQPQHKIDKNEGNLSPRSWFRKNKKDMTMPSNGLAKSKSNGNNVARWDILPIFTH